MHSSALSQLSKRSMTCDPLSYSLASLQQALRFAGSIIFPISSLPSEAHQLNWSAFLSKINKLNSFFLFLLIKVACLKLKVPVPQSAQTWSVRPSACGHNWNTIRIRLRKWSNFSLNFKRWKIWFFFQLPTQRVAWARRWLRTLPLLSHYLSTAQTSLSRLFGYFNRKNEFIKCSSPSAESKSTNPVL